MKTPHTPEPWPADMRGITFAHGSLSCGYVPPDSEPYQNSARAVQCVNACAGIEDPAKAIEAIRLASNRLVEWVKYVAGDTQDKEQSVEELESLMQFEEALQLLTPKL